MPFSHQQKCLIMIVIGNIVAVPMQRPRDIFFKPMRMAMVLDHFDVVVDCFKNQRCMSY